MPAMTNTLRIEPFLGSVDEHAAILVRIADAVGCEVREDFNGDDLIAMPGDQAREVVQEWRRARALRQGTDDSQPPVGSFHDQIVAASRRAAEAKFDE
jgi:hypothetical protein